MANWGAIIGGIIGGMIAGPQGAVVGAGMGNTFVDQPARAKSAQKRASKTQEKLAEIQAASASNIIGQRAQLTREQMEMQMKQREIETLADVIKNNDEGRKSRVYTLPPPARELSFIDRINQAIDNLLKGNF